MQNISEEEYKDLYSQLEIKNLEKLMEEMAHSPRENAGKRQPGEKCSYELQNKAKIS